jgi:hypothetical protein
VFFISGSFNVLYDYVNNIFLKKPVMQANHGILRHCLTYTDGYIYCMGGVEPRFGKALKNTTRYNIVTEKWEMLAPMNIERVDASACALNEF